MSPLLENLQQAVKDSRPTLWQSVLKSQDEKTRKALEFIQTVKRGQPGYISPEKLSLILKKHDISISQETIRKERRLAA